MNNFLSDFVNKFDFPSWLLSSLLWVIFTGIIVGIIRISVAVIRAIYVSIKLLSQNRDTLGGNGWGKHFADRFIDMWYSSDKYPLRSFGGEMYKFPNATNSRYNADVIDNELKKLGLVERDNSTYDSIFKPIKNWKNKIILCIIEFWLVNISGDNARYYEELKKRKSQ
jgi:hypothetical protein